jgi:agmatinase
MRWNRRILINRNIETFIGCDTEYEESKIVIFGVLFDSTTSFRPGDLQVK